jgi:hypothetical protein
MLLKVSELAQGLADDGEACQAMSAWPPAWGAWCQWIRPQGIDENKGENRKSKKTQVEKVKENQKEK